VTNSEEAAVNQNGRPARARLKRCATFPLEEKDCEMQPHKYGQRLAARNAYFRYARALAWTMAASAVTIGTKALFERAIKTRQLPWPEDEQEWTLLVATALFVTLFAYTSFALKKFVRIPPQRPDWSPTPEVARISEGTRKALQNKMDAIDPQTIAIITGPSGIGKSTLVRAAFSDHNDATFDQRKDVTDATRGDLRALAAAGGQTYIFLDQFEGALANSTIGNAATNYKKQLIEWLTELLEASNVRLAIIVRKEWYVDAADFIEKAGFRYAPIFIQSDPASEQLWQKRIEGLAENADLARNIMIGLKNRPTGFLAIEARICELILESAGDDNEYTITEIRENFERKGIAWFVDEFFKRVTHGSHEPSTDSMISAKVLAALAPTVAGVRTTRSIEELAWLVHESYEQVADVCEYLEAAKVIEINGDRATLIHSYISDYMTIAPNVPLDPTDRDNIATHRTQVDQGTGKVALTKFLPPRPVTLERVLVALYLFVGLGAVAAFWWFGEDISRVSKSSYDHIAAQPTTAARMRQFAAEIAAGRDPLWHVLGGRAWYFYSAIVLSYVLVHVMAMIYCDALVRNLFHIRGKRGKGEWANLSKASKRALARQGFHKWLMAVSVLFAAYSVVVLPIFVLWMGYAAVVIGLCVRGMGSDPALTSQARNVFVPVGNRIAFNIGSIGLIAAAAVMAAEYYLIFYANAPELVVFAYLLPAIPFMAGSIQGFALHASPTTLSRRRAFYDRVH
jgi:hypothetical protein